MLLLLGGVVVLAFAFCGFAVLYGVGGAVVVAGFAVVALSVPCGAWRWGVGRGFVYRYVVQGAHRGAASAGYAEVGGVVGRHHQNRHRIHRRHNSKVFFHCGMCFVCCDDFTEITLNL